MFTIDNLTVVYLVGLVSLSYGIFQAFTLRDEYQSSRIWAFAQILFGLGFIGLVYFGKGPLAKFWIGSYALVVLASLIQLTAIARFGQNPIAKVPAACCIAALALIIFLFAPLTAVYIYIAWFSWKMGRISNSIYLKLSSAAFWAYAALMAVTLLLSLFGLGRGLIDIASAEIGILALASLLLSLVTNYLWSIQAAGLSETDIQLVNFGIALEAKANAVPVFVTAPSKKGQSKQERRDVKGVKNGGKKDTLYSYIFPDKASKAARLAIVEQVEVSPDSFSSAINRS